MRTCIPEGPSGISIAILLPHAPILIPAVAGSRASECARSTEAMRMAARRLVESRPDVVVLISPHAPRDEAAFGVSSGRVCGTLARFGAPDLGADLPGAAELAAGIHELAARHGLRTAPVEDLSADHGTFVPLWFLAEAGWRGPTTVVALTWTDNDRVARLGCCVAEEAIRLGMAVGVVASGDMSHRLCPGAPCGHDPDARRFDEAFVAHLRAGATRELGKEVDRWRECAAEDVLDSTLFAFGAVGWSNEGREVLSYEAPFGVGYGVAVLYARPPANAAGLRLESLPALARASIASVLGVAPVRPQPSPGALPGRNGVFVTLHGPGGELRGCIGSMSGQFGDLAVETWEMARAAALRDPRFPPVLPAELDSLRIEVTVLDQPEPVASEAELDPRRWGVVVRTEDGRRGLLLPDLPTVTSAEEQVAIARAKGRIARDERVRLERFGARRFVEGGER